MHIQSHIAIRHLEESKPMPRSNKYDQITDWWNNKVEESVREQIELYKVGK